MHLEKQRKRLSTLGAVTHSCQFFPLCSSPWVFIEIFVIGSYVYWWMSLCILTVR